MRVTFNWKRRTKSLK